MIIISFIYSSGQASLTISTAISLLIPEQLRQPNTWFSTLLPPLPHYSEDHTAVKLNSETPLSSSLYKITEGM